MKELSTGALGSFEGQHFRFGAADAYVRPLQKPYPPLWYPNNAAVKTFAAAFTELHRIHNPVYDTRNATGSAYEDFDEQCRKGWLLVGTPSQVRERIQEQIDESGIDYMIGAFAFGAIQTSQLLHSMGLFSEQVLPTLIPAAGGAPVAVG